MLRDWISKVDKKHVSYLFWIAQGWGSYISLNMSDPEAIATLPKFNGWLIE